MVADGLVVKECNQRRRIKSYGICMGTRWRCACVSRDERTMELRVAGCMRENKNRSQIMGSHKAKRAERDA
jgi:hypothetical protein